MALLPIFLSARVLNAPVDLAPPAQASKTDGARARAAPEATAQAEDATPGPDLRSPWPLSRVIHCYEGAEGLRLRQLHIFRL